MSFAETYSQEVLQSRKVRAQRAFFWSRVVGIALMIIIAATLRADPQLRGALMQVGMNGVAQMASLKSGAQPAPALPGLTTTPNQPAPQSSALPRARIKINRPTGSASGPSKATDAQSMAAEPARALAARKVGN